MRKDILCVSPSESYEVSNKIQSPLKDSKKTVPEQIRDIDTSSLQIFGNVTYLVLDIPG